MTPDPKASHHYESDLGFTYEIPPEMKVFDSGKFESAIQTAIDQNAGKPEFSGKAEALRCARVMVSAERADESRLVIMINQEQRCLPMDATSENLALLGPMAGDEVAKRFNTSSPEYGRFAAGDHVFWVMRAAMIPRSNEAPNRFIVVALTPSPTGMLEILLQGRTQADIEAVMATRLKFSDGAETELIPASAFQAR
jgi:hypothetical protein